MQRVRYYKKVDRSLLEWGFIVPNEYVKSFEGKNHIKLGSAKDVSILFEGHTYKARLYHVNRTEYNSVYQMRWDANKELLKHLRKTFIQSYVILKSQKELFDVSKKERKYFRTHLSGGQQEVLIIEPIKPELFRLEVFIKIKNEWNELFERLAEENVFGWVFHKKDKHYLIQRSTNWIKSKDFKKHKNAINVIYYLANTKKKLIYVGKAEILGNRVKPGRQHQDMPEDWDLFRYDMIRPEFSNILERIEDHTIRALAAILENTKNFPTLKISSFKLMNKNWKRL